MSHLSKESVRKNGPLSLSSFQKHRHASCGPNRSTRIIYYSARPGVFATLPLREHFLVDLLSYARSTTDCEHPVERLD